MYARNLNKTFVIITPCRWHLGDKTYMFLHVLYILYHEVYLLEYMLIVETCMV